MNEVISVIAIFVAFMLLFHGPEKTGAELRRAYDSFVAGWSNPDGR